MMESQAVNPSNGSRLCELWNCADENLQASARQPKKKNSTPNLLWLYFFFSLTRPPAHILIITITTTAAIITSHARAFLCFQWEQNYVLQIWIFRFRFFFFPFFFLFMWRFALCSALYNDGILYAKCHSKNHTTSNLSWMSGQRNVHRAHFLSLSLSLSKRMYVKLTIALLNLSRHHQPLAVIRLK